jgi:hypothetical protein
LVSGISTELRRGRFQDGFVSAIVSKGVDLGLEGQQLDFYTEGTIAMITGGLAAKAGGGSFEDGAVQAGMVFLYNAMGKIGASVKVPTWVQKIFDIEVEGQGFSGGVAIQHPWFDGEDWDIDLYGDVSYGGKNIGIGKASLDVGWNKGKISDLNGSNNEFGVQYGFFGASLSTDIADNIEGFSLHLGPGYSIYGSVNEGRTLFHNKRC